MGAVLTGAAVPPRPAARKMTLAPLIAVTYFLVAGGPFGLEDIVYKAGYAGAILILSDHAAAVEPAHRADGGGAGRRPSPRWRLLRVGHPRHGPFLGFPGGLAVADRQPVRHGHLPHPVRRVPGAFRARADGQWPGRLDRGRPGGRLRRVEPVGIRSVGLGSVALGVVLLGPFVILTLYALFQRAPSAAAPVPLGRVDVLGGILVAMWNYMGWDNSSTIAGEVDRPRRTYPLAMAIAVALVALTYIIPIAAVALTGLDANRWSTGGWADVARAVIHNPAAGAALAAAITAGGMIGAAGSLNALPWPFPGFR